jgi:rhamnulose-1-phosphate aldolase
VINNSTAIADYIFHQIPEIAALLRRIAKVASVLHSQGWAEANAGNLSIRIGDIVKPYQLCEGLDWNDSEVYLVSRSGSRYRDIADDPVSGLLIVKVSASETFYPDEAIPTSEWACHRMIHTSDISGKYPCLLHSHPTEVIALSQTPIYANEDKLNRHLAILLPELPLYLPKGVATSDYATPGSRELAELSCKGFGDKQALIWQGHGLMCRAKDIDTALDLTEIVNKGAKLHFMLK